MAQGSEPPQRLVLSVAQVMPALTQASAGAPVSVRLPCVYVCVHARCAHTAPAARGRTTLTAGPSRFAATRRWRQAQAALAATACLDAVCYRLLEVSVAHANADEGTRGKVRGGARSVTSQVLNVCV